MTDGTEQGAADLTHRCAALEAAIGADPLVAAESLARLAIMANTAGDAVVQVRAERARARALAYAGQYDASLAQARACAQHARDHGLLEECARAQLAAMHSLVETGRLDEALSEGYAARQSLAERGDRSMIARAEINIGIVLQRQAKLQDALERFDAAADALRDEPLILGQLENNRGETLLRLFRFDDAHRSFLAARDANVFAGAGLTAAIAEGNVADLEARRGDLASAIPRFQAAIDAIAPLGAPGHLMRLRAERAETLSEGGLGGDACRAFRELIPQLDGAGLRREAARARAGLGRALMAEGQVSDARTALAAAEHEFLALGDRMDAARVALDHASVLLSTGDVHGASSLVRRAAPELASRGLDIARAELLLAHCARRARQFDEALAHASMARACGRGVRPIEARADLEESAIHRAAGRTSEALDPARRAAASFEAIRTALPARRLRLSYADASTAHALALELLLESDGPAEDVIASLEAFDARTSTEAQTADEVWSGGATADRTRRLHVQRDLAALYSLVADAGAVDARHAQWRVAAEGLEHELSDLDVRIETSGSVRSGRARSQTVHELQATLKHDEVIVRFGCVGDELMCATLSRAGSSVARGLGSVGDLDRLVRALHFHMRRAAMQADPGDPSTVNEVLRRLDAMLGLPVARAMQCAGAHAVVVPAGAASLVPFHALPSLCRPDAMVTTAPSVSTFARARSMPHKDRPERVLSVGVGGVSIPLAASEATRVASVWSDVSTACMRDDEATVSAVLHALPDADVVHIASHGWFAPSAHEASGLRLSDRWLHGREVRDLRLQADVVVLSGCETGPGGSGGDASGLLASVIEAGARRVVASLWTVRDEICIDFMDSLHRRWHHEGLAGASMAWCEQVHSLRCDRPHPAHWAPFVFCGAPQ